MSQVLVLDAGGTISSQADARGVLGGGQGLSLSADVGDVRLSLRQVHAGLSDELSLADAAAIVRAAQAAAADAADDLAGIVVAHGTDTMEETAFLADLVWTSPLPLVFTGAQRAPVHPEFDGRANLTNAVALAVNPAARDRGVLLAFGAMLASGVLAPLTWAGALVGLALIFIIRPVGGLIAEQFNGLPTPGKLAVAFLGIRGMGSIYYLSYGQNHGTFGDLDELWAIASFIILSSIVVHGIVAARFLLMVEGRDAHVHRDQDPEMLALRPPKRRS